MRNSTWGAVLGLLLLLIIPGLPGSLGAQTEFLRGDVTVDGSLGLADATNILSYLFGGGVAGPCLDAYDVDDDGSPGIADPIYLLTHLFSNGDPPPAPAGACGIDPTNDAVGCDSFPMCELGAPILGLGQAEFEAFGRGRDLMTKRFSLEEGAGPFFNTTSCAACHSTPVTGGSAPMYRNFFLAALGDPGIQIPLQDPPLPSIVLPSYGELDGQRPRVPDNPPELLTLAQRNAPPMLGVGLFELVSNTTILANADPNDSNGDGISGRFNTDGFGNLGRFGYKSQANFIEAFIRGAAQNQMGITTDPVEGGQGIVNLKWLQVGTGFDEPTSDDDGVPDPEISVEDFADIIAFNRFLAPPRKKDFGPAESAGEAQFGVLGCDGCHIPVLDSDVGPLEAYTDLLLHDMGPELADGISMGVPQLSANDGMTTESEFRTQPLWGVSLHRPFLHDGRADSLYDAIIMHGGEAAAIRDDFLALPALTQQNIIAFLEAL